MLGNFRKRSSPEATHPVHPVSFHIYARKIIKGKQCHRRNPYTRAKHNHPKTTPRAALLR